MTYGYPTNPPYVMGSSLLTVFGLGSSLETVFGMGSPPLGVIPNQVAGLVGWYDASQIVGISSGASLSAWTDLSTAGNHLGQSVATSQPIFLTNQQNGLSAVSFCGLLASSATRSVMTAAFTLAQPTTLVMTFSLNTKVAAAQQNVADGFAGASMILGTAASGAGTAIEAYAGTGAIGVTSYSVNSWYVASVVFNGASSAISFAGVGATGNAGASSPNGFAVGGRQTASSVYAQAKVGEIALYNVAVPAGTLRGLEQYMKLKWNTF